MCGVTERTAERDGLGCRLCDLKQLLCRIPLVQLKGLLQCSKVLNLPRLHSDRHIREHSINVRYSYICQEYYLPYLM